jgi:putative flippase GtrA
MARLSFSSDERRLALKFAGASLVGFATDAALLHVGLAAGITPAWARVISLLSAMQVTFVINALLVFKGRDRSRPLRQWATYMAAHGFGNLCNYWIFVTLVSTHWPVASAPLFALAVGAVTAWMINYCGARLLVFRKARRSKATSPPRTYAVIAPSLHSDLPRPLP